MGTDGELAASRSLLFDVWRGSERAPSVRRRRNGPIVRPNVDGIHL